MTVSKRTTAKIFFVAAFSVSVFYAGRYFQEKAPNNIELRPVDRAKTEVEHYDAKTNQIADAKTAIALQQLNSRIARLEENNGDSNPETGASKRKRVNREELREKVYEKKAREQAIFESILAGRDTDPSWSQSFEKKIERHFEEEEYPGSRLESVVCKSKVCRISLAHQDDGTRHENVEKLSFDLPEHGRGWWKNESDEDNKAWRTIYYIVRKGHRVDMKTARPD